MTKRFLLDEASDRPDRSPVEWSPFKFVACNSDYFSLDERLRTWPCIHRRRSALKTLNRARGTKDAIKKNIHGIIGKVRQIADTVVSSTGWMHAVLNWNVACDKALCATYAAVIVCRAQTRFSIIGRQVSTGFLNGRFDDSSLAFSDNTAVKMPLTAI